MPRTNQDAVIAVLALNYDTDFNPDVTPFIEAASALVDQVAQLAPARAAKLGVPAPTAVNLELIERWLAAHYYHAADPLEKSSNTAEASSSFQEVDKDGLQGTTYGRRAVMLDTSGTLLVLDQRKFAGMSWMGKPPSQQIPYDQRN